MRLFQYVFLIFSYLLSVPLQAADPQIAVSSDAVMVLKQDGSVVGWGNIPAEDGSTRFTDIATALELDDVDVAVFNPEDNSTSRLFINEKDELWVTPDSSISFALTTYNPAQNRVTLSDLVMTNVADYSLARNHLLILDKNGDVWGVGTNSDGQLGTGDNINRATPTKINISGVEQIFAVNEFRNIARTMTNTPYSLALKKDGTVWGWGHFKYLGLSDQDEDQLTPVKILDNVKTLDNAVTNSVALKNDGTVWGWGKMNTSLTEPTQFDINDVAIVQTHGGLFVALKNDGSIWTWGDNYGGLRGSGGLGNGLQLAYQDTPHPLVRNTLYMPEGFIGDEIEEFVALLNTHDETVNATCYIYYEDGTGFSFPLELLPERRSSFSLKQKGVAFYRPFAIVIEPEKRITATMIHYAEGNIALGANFTLVTNKEWSTAQGFFDHEGKIRNYLVGFNPNDEAVDIDLRITGFTEDFPKSVSLTVQPKSRFSVKLQDYLNNQIPQQPIGALVLSDKDIVVAMSHYDDNLGDGTLTIAEPSRGALMGMVAEGWLSNSGFEVINILNPNNGRNAFNLFWRTPEMQRWEQQFTISLALQPYQQTALVLKDFFPENQPFSLYWQSNSLQGLTLVTSFNHFDLSGLNGVNFTSKAARHWEFAEGFKGDGVQEFLLVQKNYNSTNQDLNVKVKLYYHDGQANAELDLLIPAGEVKAALFLHTDDRVRAGQGIMYGITVDADEPIVPYFTHYDFNFGGAFALSGTGWNP